MLDHLHNEVTLDIEALVEYSGEGACKEIELNNNATLDRYSEELRTWAKRLENQTVFIRLD